MIQERASDPEFKNALLQAYLIYYSSPTSPSITRNLSGGPERVSSQWDLHNRLGRPKPEGIWRVIGAVVADPQARLLIGARDP